MFANDDNEKNIKIYANLLDKIRNNDVEKISSEDKIEDKIEDKETQSVKEIET
jgi:hypothetical protein